MRAIVKYSPESFEPTKPTISAITRLAARPSRMPPTTGSPSLVMPMVMPYTPSPKKRAWAMENNPDMPESRFHDSPRPMYISTRMAMFI